MTLLIFLIAGHFVADYPLQGDFLSKAKRAGPLRVYHLCGHCAIHAAMVLLITGSVVASIFEFIAHLVIDENKVHDRISFAVDQALHIFCKLIIWAALIYAV